MDSRSNVSDGEKDHEDFAYFNGKNLSSTGFATLSQKSGVGNIHYKIQYFNKNRRTNQS